MNNLTLTSFGSVGSATQAQLDYVTSKLAPHPKSIKQQYLEDQTELTFLGITPKQIADKCEVIFLKAMNLLENSKNGFNNTAIIEGNFEITGFAVRAMCMPQPCAFTIDRPCGFDGAKFTITNLNIKESITIREVQLHIMRDHEFFARTGTPLRIDPALACRVLQLKPGVDYSKELKIKDIWERCRSSTCPKTHKATLESTSLQSQTIDHHTTAYLMKSRDVIPDPKEESLQDDFDDFWSTHIIITSNEKEESEDETEEPFYLHVTGGNESFLKNVDVLGRSIESLFVDEDELSVLKPSTIKYAVAGPEDRLAEMIGL